MNKNIRLKRRVKGISLMPILEMFCRWGHEHIEKS